MRSRQSLRWLLLLCGAPLASCGGSDERDTGLLVVPYELGNHRDCESLGVESVRAELDDGRYVVDGDCDADQIRFNLLEPGNYDVVVYGLDADGVPILDSLVGGPRSIDVVGDGTTVVVDPALKLTAAPAHLQLRWALGFGTCESTAIDSFGITAWRGDGSDLLMETELPCDMTGEGAAQYRLVPDDERQLRGDELGEVDVQPYDKDGIAVGDPITFTFESPGAGRKVKLSLTCDAGGCEGSGAPD
jgi:hypothetical protein